MNRLYNALSRYFGILNEDIQKDIAEHISERFGEPLSLDGAIRRYADKHENDDDADQLVENIEYLIGVGEHSIGEMGEIYDLVDALMCEE